MESFSRGWNFLTQAWKMAMADKDLIKPSIYALLVGFVVSIIGIIPIGLAAFLLGTESLVGRVVLGIFGALLVFAQYAVAYIFSAMTVKLIYDYLTDGDGRMDRAWQIVKRDWLDILSLAAASTLVSIVKNAVRGGGKNRNFMREAVANLIDTVWTEATFLVLPIMVIEDENLKDGLKRATYIVKNNLLLVGIVITHGVDHRLDPINQGFMAEAGGERCGGLGAGRPVLIGSCGQFVAGAGCQQNCQKYTGNQIGYIFHGPLEKQSSLCHSF